VQAAIAVQALPTHAVTWRRTLELHDDGGSGAWKYRLDVLFDEAAAGATIAAVWCRVGVRRDGGIGSGDAGGHVQAASLLR